MGIAGSAEVEDMLAFIDETGTDGFTQLNDADGSLWQRFGTEGRSTFMFVNDDGSSELTSYGVADEARLVAEIERLSAS